MRNRLNSVVVTVAAATVMSLTGVLNAQSFSITQIPTLDPSNSGSIYPQGISPTGVVTGYYYQNTTRQGNVANAFDAQVTGSTVTSLSLGYPGGDIPVSDTSDYPTASSYDFGINAAGTSVGGGISPTNDSEYTLTEYGSVPMQDLGHLPTPGTYPSLNYPSFAASISTGGVVAGASVAVAPAGTTRRFVHAVVYTPGQGLTDLSDGLTTMSVGYGINPAGNVVVGFNSPQTGTGNGNAMTGKVASMWTLSGSSWTQTSLGTLGGAQSVAYGVNAAGTVVGVAQTASGSTDPFLIQPGGKMIDLLGTTSGAGSLGNPIPGSGLTNNPMIAPNPNQNGNILNTGLGASSCADAINDLGQVVGYYGGTANPTAFLATVDANGNPTLINLNTLIPTAQQKVWHLSEATAINDQEQIVGWGINSNAGGETGFELNLAPIGTWNSSTGGSWTVSSNWVGGIPNAVGTVATFGATPGLTTNGSVTLDGNQTVGHIVFNNNTNSYSLNAGTGGTLTINDTTDLAGPSPTITVSAGSHTINAPIVLATNGGNMGVTINTWAGTSLALGGAVTAMNNGSGTLTTEGGGTLVINPGCSIYVPLVANGPITFTANTNTSSGLTLHTVSSITLGATTPVTVAPALTQASRQLLITMPILQTATYANSFYTGTAPQWVGQIDLANNDMDVPDGNLSVLTAQVAEGFNIGNGGGNWTGTNLLNGYVMGGTTIYNGILSSSAANDTTHLTALGIIQNMSSKGTRIYSTFDGQPVASTDVLIKYTYYGDANLDGEVDGSDYSLIDNGFNNQLTGWYNGDFNYDGVIDGSDYTLIDNDFNTQGASLAAKIAANSAAQVAGSTSAVPEPVALGLLTMIARCTLRRRKHR